MVVTMDDAFAGKKDMTIQVKGTWLECTDRTTSTEKEIVIEMKMTAKNKKFSYNLEPFPETVNILQGNKCITFHETYDYWNQIHGSSGLSRHDGGETYGEFTFTGDVYSAKHDVSFKKKYKYEVWIHQDYEYRGNDPIGYDDYELEVHYLADKFNWKQGLKDIKNLFG